MTQDVAQVFNSLTREERSRTPIYTQNYGEAGAIDFFGSRYGLPKAISGHNSYWLWGTHGATVEIVIIIGGRKSDHERGFESVEQVALHSADFAMPYETNLPIYLCRKPKMSIQNLWTLTRHFI